MGCVASKNHKEERVQLCKERKRLMKQLVILRGDFADAQIAYLRALKNTGVTLRQFTESESLELETASDSQAMPPSPPLPLPPSPPPPPPFSPDLQTSSPCDSLDSAEGLQRGKSQVMVANFEEENWAETKTEFEEEEDPEGEGVTESTISVRLSQIRQPKQVLKVIDDDSSIDTAEGAMVQWRNKKTLEGIVKELDDYFLKASAGGKDTAVLMDISKQDTSLSQNFKENKRKRSNSAKVFTSLSWSWSSKSLQFATDTSELCSPTEPCKPGAHRITLAKLYAAEQKLYKEMKEEEMTKSELEKKTMSLLKQEEENHDWTKAEKTRSSVEDLETDLRRLQHQITTSCSYILELIDLELCPQLIALTSGLKSMWRTMYECHQVQNHISQQLNHVTDNQSADSTSEYHRQATAQLENEVTLWYLSFCKLLESQNEYVKTLSRWIELTNCLVDESQPTNCSSAVRSLCREWQLAFDKLPNKIASESIKGLMNAIKMITLQQTEEYNLRKKSEKLEKRLQKELLALSEMEKRVDWSVVSGDAESDLSPKHPLSVKRAKAEALRKRVESEQNKYQNAVEATRLMTLSNLKTNLPNVFQALMGFSSASVLAFEGVLSHGKPAVDCDASGNEVG